MWAFWGEVPARAASAFVLAIGLATFGAVFSADTAATLDGRSPLWVAHSDRLLAIDATEGEVVLDVPSDERVRAVAADRVYRRVWAQVGLDGLRAYDFEGNQVVDTALPVSLLQAISPRAVAVDGQSGNVWTAVGNTLYRHDLSGELQDERVLSLRAIRGLAVDPERSRLWVADRRTLYAFGPDGEETFRKDAETFRLRGIDDIAFDSAIDRLWVVGKGRIARYDEAGDNEYSGDVPGPANHIAPDHDGGAWVATPKRLHHVDQSGLVTVTVQPYSDGALPNMLLEGAIDLSSEPDEGTAWITSRDRVRNYAQSGELLHTIVVESDGFVGGVNALSASAPQPVSVAIGAPEAGALINDSMPTLEIAVDGLDPAPEQLGVDADDEPVPASCVSTGDGFECALSAALPEGESTLVAHVESEVGTRFDSEPVTVTVDTVPPVITLAYPPAGHITNEPELDILGELGEHATLSINGENVTLASDWSFSHAVLLEEGTNAFQLQAEDAAGNLGDAARQVTLDTVAPDDPETSRIDGVASEGTTTVSGEAGAVEPGAQVDLTNTRTGATITLEASPEGAFSGEIEAESGDSITIVARDAAGNQSASVEIVVRDDNVPPDPGDVAPPLPDTGSPPFGERIAFLYSGDNPIQRDVAPGTIEDRRVSVLRGHVRDRSGAPIPGVTVSILDHPELGHTATRADGVFDIAVNGGGVLTVEYRKDGYLPVQRTIDTQWNGWYHADDVVMVPLDDRVTSIDLTDDSEPFQVARGSVVQDSDGQRQATLLFPAGTTAEITLPDGSKQQLDQLDVRATEYTVGDSGPDAMPAKLPPASAYTYAVELSVDQALEQGIKVDGKDVVFNQEVPFYVDNFLDFPTGEAVPVGYYNNDAAAWVPYDNGRIVEILEEQDGQAVLDVTGDGDAATATELDELGITDAERTRLASLYDPGASLWRVALSHLSTWTATGPMVRRRMLNLRRSSFRRVLTSLWIPTSRTNAKAARSGPNRNPWARRSKSLECRSRCTTRAVAPRVRRATVLPFR